MNTLYKDCKLTAVEDGGLIAIRQQNTSGTNLVSLTPEQFKFIAQQVDLKKPETKAAA